MAKILVAMSGGIDSTVVAYKLQKDGHHIEGVYMKLHKNDSYHDENIKKLEKVCSHINIKYHVLDLQDEFTNCVYNPFIDTYKEGLTPNPCVVCNKTIKFGKLIEFAKDKNFDKLATGHYVKIKDGFFAEAYDKSKDQSYFLSNVNPSLCDFLVFPLGNMLKSEVKEFAQDIEILKSFVKQKESSEICFVEDTYIDVLKEHIAVDNDGIVVDKNGNEIGEHKGYMHYTIGKRKGFNVRIAHEPHYVTNIDASKNIIEVGLKDELKISEFKVKDMACYIDKNEFESSVKIRYRSPKTPCFVKINLDKTAIIKLQMPVYGLAPGQYAVFYDKDKVIASGIITK